MREPEKIPRCSHILFAFINQNLINGYMEISYPRFYGKYKIVGLRGNFSGVKEELILEQEGVVEKQWNLERDLLES